MFNFFRSFFSIFTKIYNWISNALQKNNVDAKITRIDHTESVIQENLPEDFLIMKEMDAKRKEMDAKRKAIDAKFEERNTKVFKREEYNQLYSEYNQLYSDHELRHRIVSMSLALTQIDMNNLEIFNSWIKPIIKDKQSNYQQSTYQQPLVVYAIDSSNDYSGAIMSQWGLKTAKMQYQNLTDQGFNVIPMLFANKAELDEKLTKFNKDMGHVSHLILNGHGSNDSFGADFCKDINLKIAGITSDTKIILSACQTAMGKVEESIAYQVAVDNGCTVYGATDTISDLAFIKNKKGKIIPVYYSADIEAVNAVIAVNAVNAVKINARPTSDQDKLNKEISNNHTIG